METLQTKPSRYLTRTVRGVCVQTPERETIGMVRIVGDGGTQLFVTDVIVRKDWQNQGIGTAIMKLILEEISECAPPGCFIGLFSALGREAFYQRFGFIIRPNERLGAGMAFYP